MATEAMGGGSIRAFLALDPPAEILARVGILQERLRGLIRGDIRWVRPEGIHLTLKFFGDISPADVGRIAAIVAAAAANQRPLSLSLGGVGVFPDPRRPRVLWLGLNGDLPPLLSFQQGLERALAGIGFPPEGRPFRAHLTLARIRSPRGLTGLGPVLEKGGAAAAGGFVAAAVGLWRSELTPRGAIYTRLHDFPLAGMDGR
jgi:RNA 2',3'-cyclic 3'-phosphodiesterase